jgi:hypothetical protein
LPGIAPLSAALENRLFAWLNKYKRVITRWDRCHEHCTAFVHLAFSMILMRRV